MRAPPLIQFIQLPPSRASTGKRRNGRFPPVRLPWTFPAPLPGHFRRAPTVTRVFRAFPRRAPGSPRPIVTEDRWRESVSLGHFQPSVSGTRMNRASWRCLSGGPVSMRAAGIATRKWPKYAGLGAGGKTRAAGRPSFRPRKCGEGEHPAARQRPCLRKTPGRP